MESERDLLLHPQQQRKGCNKTSTAILTVLGVFVIAGVITVAVLPHDKQKSKTKDTTLFQEYASSSKSSYGRYNNAAVASDAEQCSNIGKDILLEGGSAVDSAIATSLCIGLHGSQASGIGGGSFMMIYESPRNSTIKELTALDFRETAPLKTKASMYKRHSSYRGSHSIAIPGEISGYWEAWTRYGRLPWKRLFEPTIDMCKEGYIISDYHGKALRGAAASGLIPGCEGNKSISTLVYKEDGTLIKPGDTLKLPRLAKTMEKIAVEGGQTFYTGQLAKEIVKDIADMGGIITLEDLRTYKPVWRKPIKFDLNVASDKKVKVAGLNAPSAGPQLNFIFNIINGYKDSVKDSTQYHRIIEAFKFSYSMKTRVGDPDLVNVDDVINNMTSKTFASHIRGRIDDTMTHDVMYYDPVGRPPHNQGTSHISVYSEGSAVSLTSTVNSLFGSQCKGPRSDIVLNDEIDDFTFPSDDFGFGNVSNSIEPGKRPVSAMTPVIVFDEHGDVISVVGAAGSSKITTTVATVLYHYLYQGMPMNEAVDYPRIHHSLMPNEVTYEHGFPKNVIDQLINIGHHTRSTNNIAFCNAIGIENDENQHTRHIIAVSDKRKGGKPSGY